MSDTTADLGPDAYVSYTKYLILDSSPAQAGLVHPAFDHPLLGIDLCFQYVRPFPAADLNSEPIGIIPDDHRLRVGFDPTTGFTFSVESSTETAAQLWAFEEAFTYPWSEHSPTLGSDTLRRVLLDLGDAVAPDARLQEIAYTFSCTPVRDAATPAHFPEALTAPFTPTPTEGESNE
ncbi:hypothetical protein FCK90_14460 [Kocuria coralli]|uniref:Uncharacterized protein n=1 Tax=Kocuria coralli TaxID=1461025 RepID=A0A5J5KTN6_9MICC|nr:hypothetical protein [Kocuria coralli]KAA9393003.1 hypothetical protein FCK90_14460 [Kocuria coralli]